MIRITKSMNPEQRAIAYVKNIIEETGADIYQHETEYMYTITKVIEALFPLRADMYRNRLDTVAKVREVVNFIKDEKEMYKFKESRSVTNE